MGIIPSKMRWEARLRSREKNVRWDNRVNKHKNLLHDLVRLLGAKAETLGTFRNEIDLSNNVLSKLSVQSFKKMFRKKNVDPLNWTLSQVFL
jgi:hypothetical protein